LKGGEGLYPPPGKKKRRGEKKRPEQLVGKSPAARGRKIFSFRNFPGGPARHIKGKKPHAEVKEKKMRPVGRGGKKSERWDRSQPSCKQKGGREPDRGGGRGCCPVVEPIGKEKGVPQKTEKGGSSRQRRKGPLKWGREGRTDHMEKRDNQGGGGILIKERKKGGGGGITINI